MLWMNMGLSSNMVQGRGLIITEKPSVARDVTAALGGFHYHQSGYWESENYLCTYAIGHLLSLAEPEEIDPRYKKWSLDILPLLPPSIPLKPISEHEPRLRLIKSLADRNDVTYLINACDAAREGELIFREIIEYIQSRKWTKRLWLQSLTTASIRKAFETLRDGVDFDGLGDAARCRAYSDWLIGMNGTRAATERLRKDGGGQLGPGAWSIGRVQTPTLKILVHRELEILGHRPQTFFRICAFFATKDHSYEGGWYNPQIKNSLSDHGNPVRQDRIFQEEKAQWIVQDVLGMKGEASEHRDQSIRHAPRLFNLTALQKHMSMRYRWDAKKTLDIAQRCYEQHKVLTYPRTQSVCLPEDYLPLVKKLLTNLQADPRFRSFACELERVGLRNQEKIFDNKGVDDHFAIIPTGVQKALSGDDLKLYENVVLRLLAAFYPAAIYDKVVRTTRIVGRSRENHFFRTGPLETLRSPGWLSVVGLDNNQKPKVELPPLSEGSEVTCTKADLKKDETKPPARIGEAQLLSLMENAGRTVEDQELAMALMSAEGLGTAATRADIIQNLKQKAYVDYSLRPQFKGMHLILSLETLGAERVTSPDLTAKLELQLSEVEKSRRHPKQFMKSMEAYIRDLVARCREADLERLLRQRPPLGPCPGCGESQIEERPLFYCCAPIPGKKPGCGYRVFKEMGGRYLDRKTMGDLLNSPERTIDGVEGFGTHSKDHRIRLSVEGGNIVARDGMNVVVCTSHQDVPFELTVRTGARAAPRKTSMVGGSKPNQHWRKRQPSSQKSKAIRASRNRAVSKEPRT